jgi:hypothetical protein
MMPPEVRGRRIHVRIDVRPPASATTQAIEHRPPPGARVRQISHGGVFDAATGLVKWGPFFDDQPRTLTYRIVLPPGVAMTRLRGRVSFDGVVERIREGQP